MITNKIQYYEYLEMDRKAQMNFDNRFSDRLKTFISPNPIIKFQKLMRKLEYYSNCKDYGIGKLYVLYLRYLYKKASLKLGFSIPINVFGPGLSIVHYGTIVINKAAKIGANCRMHACVNIGASGGESAAPQLGNNVYIAPGAKIYGAIKIADNCAIGANAVVNKSFEEQGIMIAGNPAKKIKSIDIKKIIKHI